MTPDSDSGTLWKAAHDALSEWVTALVEHAPTTELARTFAIYRRAADEARDTPLVDRAGVPNGGSQEVTCPDCGGSGDIAQAVDLTDAVGCPRCGSSGVIEVQSSGGETDD